MNLKIFYIQNKDYIGCYGDSNTHDLTLYVGLPNNNSNVSPQICAQACAGYLYSATQAGAYCWCGNSYGKYGVSTGCNAPCNGNPNIICGGSWANSVYSVNVQMNLPSNLKIF